MGKLGDDLRWRWYVPVGFSYRRIFHMPRTAGAIDAEAQHLAQEAQTLVAAAQARLAVAQQSVADAEAMAQEARDAAAHATSEANANDIPAAEVHCTVARDRLTAARNRATQVFESLETPREKLAAERAHKDMQTSGETARAAAQAAVLINGGAATAILAYLSKDAHTPSTVLHAAAITLAAYAIGVAWGAWSMWCSSQASAEWGYRWESVLDHDPVGEQQFRTSAEGWLFRHRGSMGLSILLFIGSSCWIALAFFKSI
jgi:hypothetical protein